MRSHAAKPRRRNALRLRGFDSASPGAYFVTVCTHRKACILGSVVDGESRPSATGKIVAAGWQELPDHYPSLEPDSMVVMPNHIYAIVFLPGPVGAGLRPAPTPHEGSSEGRGEGRRVTFSEVLRAFKSHSARRINIVRGTPGAPVWQRGFYEHVVRNEADLDRIRRYIEGSPQRWAEDDENPSPRQSLRAHAAARSRGAESGRR